MKHAQHILYQQPWLHKYTMNSSQELHIQTQIRKYISINFTQLLLNYLVVLEVWERFGCLTCSLLICRISPKGLTLCIVPQKGIFYLKNHEILRQLTFLCE